MICDCFTFFDELELLDIRLHELDPVVDRFVLVEAPLTYSGKSKPLYFTENKARYAEFLHKIVHVVVDDMPNGPDGLGRQRHQFDELRRGLDGTSDDDTVMLSHADEIPRAASVNGRAANRGIASLAQRSCRYWLNCCSGMRPGTRVVNAGLLRTRTPTEVRQSSSPVIADSGWHFAFLGGPERILRKLAARPGGTDLADASFNERFLKQVTATGIDLFGGAEHWEFVPLDEQFPRYVLENRPRFGPLYRDASFTENWYGDHQLGLLARACTATLGLEGLNLELGAWEGRSTVLLCNALFPEELHVVDTWRGNEDEHPEHSTVLAARSRDVHGAFARNIRALTEGNAIEHREDHHDFIARLAAPVKFCHVDASHDYRSTSRILCGLRPRVVPGGVICGDDFLSASAGREDLQGGVERAVREAFGSSFEQTGNFWCWHAT